MNGKFSLPMLLQQIPPPLFSDGLMETVQNAINQGWEIQESFIPSFLNPIVAQLKELYIQHPELLNPPLEPNSFSFSQQAFMIQLPERYALLTNNEQIILVGHPSGNVFRTSIEFLPHLVWLIYADVKRSCRCHLCQPKESIRPVPLRNPQSIPFMHQYLPGGINQYSRAISNNQRGTPAIPGTIPTGIQIPSRTDSPSTMSPRLSNSIAPSSPFQSVSLHTIPQNMPPNEVNRNMGPHHPRGSMNSISAINMNHEFSGVMSPYTATTPVMSSISPIVSIKDSNGPIPNTISHIKASSLRIGDASRNINIVLETSNDDSLNPKLKKLVVENQSLESQVKVLENSIVVQKKKLERLKFERRLLLGALTASDPLSVKRALQDDSDISDAVEEKIPITYIEDRGLSEDEVDELDDGDVFELTPRKKVRKKKQKLLDPNAPKRPLNAYMIFSETQRECIKEEKRLVSKLMPGSELDQMLTNQTKATAQKWKLLHGDDILFYKDVFQNELKRYNDEMKQYSLLHPNAPKEGDVVLPNSFADPNSPKRSIHPFFYFCEAQDAKLAEKVGTSNGEEERLILEMVSKCYAQKWRELSSEDKKGIIVVDVVYEHVQNEKQAVYQRYIDEHTKETIVPTLELNQIENEEQDELSSVQDIDAIE